MKKRLLALTLALVLACALLTGCAGRKTDPYETAVSMIDGDVQSLIDAIGEPNDSQYASSCLGDGEDGELYYDGFTVYTYRDVDGTESVYDVMQTGR